MPEGAERPEDTDAAWNEIIANYGERARLNLSDLDAQEARDPIPPPAEDPDRFEPEPETEHFIPPTPPKAPRPRGARALAWLGLFGAPTVALVLLMFGVEIPGLLGIGLAAAFVGGLVYLLTGLPRDEDIDPWDDGAVV